MDTIAQNIGWFVFACCFSLISATLFMFYLVNDIRTRKETTMGFLIFVGFSVMCMVSGVCSAIGLLIKIIQYVHTHQ